MTAERYVAAFSRALHSVPEKDHQKLTERFLEYIREQRHEKLLPRIAELLAVEQSKPDIVLTIAKKKDEAAARKESDAPKDVDIQIDERLIGGWRLQSKTTLTDTSHKTALIDLYRTITT